METLSLNKKERAAKAVKITATVLGAVMLAVFLPLLVFNLVYSIVAYVKPGVQPSVFGTSAIIENTDLMNGASGIKKGDLVLISASPEELKVGNVVAAYENGTLVLRRIEAVTADEQYILKADAAENADEQAVTRENILGTFKNRVPFIGAFVLFSQSTVGIILFIGLPALLFVAYDIAAKAMADKRGRKAQEQPIAEQELEAGSFVEENVLGGKDTLTVLSAEPVEAEKVVVEVKTSRAKKHEQGVVGFPTD